MHILYCRWSTAPDRRRTGILLVRHRECHGISAGFFYRASSWGKPEPSTTPMGNYPIDQQLTIATARSLAVQYKHKGVWSRRVYVCVSVRLYYGCWTIIIIKLIFVHFRLLRKALDENVVGGLHAKFSGQLFTRMMDRVQKALPMR